MAKALGADIIDFYKNGWPDGWYHDDNLLEVEENDEHREIVQPDQTYDLQDLGVLVKEDDSEDHISFETGLKRYLKKRDTETIVVTLPKAKAEEFRAEMKARGLKVS